MFQNKGDGSNFENIEISYGSANVGGGMWLYSPSVSIKNCTIFLLSANTGGAIVNHSPLTMSDSTIAQCTARDSAVITHAETLLINVTFASNVGVIGGGLHIDNVANGRINIDSCKFLENIVEGAESWSQVALISQ